MIEERRNLCRVKVSRDMVQVTYEPIDQGSLQAHSTFDHKAALRLNASPTKAELHEYGRSLYDLLFLADPKQNVSAVFRRCFDDASAKAQLAFEIVDETLPELLELSWEHLCDQDARYLALESRFRLVRRLSSLPLGREMPIDGAPRVLVVVSSPDNLETFAIDTLGVEGRQSYSFAPLEAPFLPQQTLGLAELFDELQREGKIAGYRILRGPLPPPHDNHPALLPGYPTLNRIYQVLQEAEANDQPYHIVHILAHGYLDEGGSGNLLLTNEMGDAAPIHENTFQSLFPQGHQVRLVLLAACQSGGGEQRVGEPLAGLAPAFLRLGIQAVIAMQSEVSKRGAAAFTETFYRELARHGYADTAMVEARREMDRRVPSGGEWVTPVMYLQSEAPRIFRSSRVEFVEQGAVNPFYTSGRINEPSLFFGRKRIVREIWAELRKGCSVSIVGDAQVGKSSLLYYLYQSSGECLPGRTVEYVDLQSVLDEQDFCETVLSKLGEGGDTLRALKRALANRELVLLLDEVERLAEEDFNPRLHDLLRSLAQEPHFAMCLASDRSLDEVFPARTPGGVSPFHNIFTQKHLGPFAEDEARDCIIAYLNRTNIAFTEREVDRLLIESRCHPAELQARASALFEEKS